MQNYGEQSNFTNISGPNLFTGSLNNSKGARLLGDFVCEYGVSRESSNVDDQDDFMILSTYQLL